jgi:hypothetical protein
VGEEEMERKGLTWKCLTGDDCPMTSNLVNIGAQRHPLAPISMAVRVVVCSFIAYRSNVVGVVAYNVCIEFVLVVNE